MVLYLLQMKVTRHGTQHLSELHHLLSVESTLLQSNCLRTSDAAIKLMIDPDQRMKITISKVFVHTCKSQVAKLPIRCHFQRDVQHLTGRSVAEKTKKAIDRNRCEMIRRNLLIPINVK
jgi:hypothetical protein